MFKIQLPILNSNNFFLPSVDLHNNVAPHKSIRVPSVNSLLSVGTAGPWTAALRDSRNPNTLPPT